MPKTELLSMQRADAGLLARLMQFYVYDFSEMNGGELDEGGAFAIGDMARYWRKPFHPPFLIRADGVLAGFAIISKESRLWPEGITSDMAEFFVLRRYRRQGVGASAANLAFAKFPGRWEVRQIAANTGATAFWRAVIQKRIGTRFDELFLDDERWRGRVQVFVEEVGQGG